MKALRDSHPDFKYLYTMRKDGRTLRFVVDADYGNKEDPGAAIGEAYEIRNDEILVGFERPTAETQFYTDKWGTLMSGYAPVRNSRGQTVALVGVDMASGRVLQKQRYLGSTIYVIMVVGVVAAGLFIFVFSKTIIKDVKALNEVANQISTGNTNVRMHVSRKDEIGELADSFGRMVASLKIMMMQDAD
jgi:adenylate cyclase